MSLFSRMAIQMTRHEWSQRLLERIIDRCQYLMGIGAGDSVNNSGEDVALSLLQERSSQPFCIFDVGANKGQYLNLIHQVLPPNSFVVHSFEPGLETFRVLSENAPKGTAVTLNNMALGRQRGSLPLYYEEKGSGLASLTKRRLDHFNVTFDMEEIVTVDTLDNYCEGKGISRIHLLKLDVEGHEMDVLLGASSLLERRAIDMIAFEFGGCNIDTHIFFQDFFYFFNRIGMTMYRILPSGSLYRINSYKEIQEQFRTTNYLCTQEDERPA